jgi:hypothetical protein
MKFSRLISIPAVLGAVCVAPQGFALPTMIRLGYPSCASCHISPQGGGLLNPYGHGVDQAQSLIGGEYAPSEDPLIRLLNWNGGISQDFRSVIQQQDTSTSGKAGTQLFRSRFMYRNATELGKGFRITATVTGENTSVLRPALAYDPPATASQVFLNTALLSYRAGNALEFAVGRDQLPTGLNIPDLSFFIKSHNNLGYYDSPTQAKMFWWSKRYMVVPYAFGPGGNEKSGFHESGGGLLGEFDFLGKGRTVAGLNVLRGTASAESRWLLGPYARLGFGSWGILAEHDITNHNFKLGIPATFQQTASYGQLFWAAREWLVPSLFVERLRADRPYEERLDAARLDLAVRLTSQITISAGPRIQHDRLTGQLARSVLFQIALKTVH